MTDTALETPKTPPAGEGRTDDAAAAGAARSPLRRFSGWLAALGIVVLAGIVILVTGTRPGYDPYGWLDWGYQTWHGSLNLGGAPSWKPFTYLFNVPFALFGHYALWLWMLTAVSMSLAGALFGGRIAYRLTAREAADGPRWAPLVAAVFAGAFVLGIQEYFHYLLSVQSDPMLVTTCLAAIDCFLSGRLRWAWWLGALTALGRPEVWPFVGLYGIWLWIKVPATRWMVAVGVLGNAFLWFGVPTITNGRPDIAGQLALKSPRELHNNKIIGTWNRFTALQYWPVELAAVLAVALAALRRNLTVLVLAAMTLGWVVIEIAFALHGFPGVPRYLFEPAGLTGVLAGIAVGWLLLDVSRVHRAIPRWAGVPLVVALFALMVPQAVSQIRLEHKDIYHERARTKEINKLAATINALGGYRHVLRCGHPVLNVEYVSIMAWYTHLNTGVIGYRPKIELNDRRYPIVVFTAFPNGWGVQTYRTPAALKSTCANLKAIYVPTARHPDGVLIPK
ncbi:MAG TPA: hypothetical protein VF781_10100 [Solirubrobacteraceae bacterium]